MVEHGVFLRLAEFWSCSPGHSSVVGGGSDVSIDAPEHAPALHAALHRGFGADLDLDGIAPLPRAAVTVSDHGPLAGQESPSAVGAR
ncbi:hypothetical protein [Nitrogeniibacter aestuarii]|uniref:hypothetical protein n=1 Tax=Nitrogeniibacter aestuarii TaxID=2815343 RepID=UPI001D0FC8DB|nr:hypothetical protein [Nitrogeniibacter aestuarii]